MSDFENPDIEGALCVGCAMCCNGTLYGRAKVAVGEERKVLDHGLELLSDEGKSYFRLPCQYESCGRCTIYETRFEVCRTFSCALLRHVRSGETTLEEGQQHVATAQELLRKVVDADPDAATFRGRAQLREALAKRLTAEATEDERRTTGERLLNIVALDSYLDRWFRNKKKSSQDAEEVDISDSNS